MASATTSSNGAPADVLDVLIVGAGFSGLGMAIKLLQGGSTSFLLIEKADDIGGTWYANRYPGCACDIPSHLYSFSFDRNPGWSRMFSPREEIQAYLKSCAKQYGTNRFPSGASLPLTARPCALACWYLPSAVCMFPSTLRSKV